MSSSSISITALNNTGLLLTATAVDGVGKKRIKPNELGLDCEHSVVRLSAITTKHGRAILCELNNNNSVILPGRFASSLSDADLVALNQKQLSLVYKGSCATRHKPTALIEFREKPQPHQQQQQ